MTGSNIFVLLNKIVLGFQPGKFIGSISMIVYGNIYWQSNKRWSDFSRWWCGLTLKHCVFSMNLAGMYPEIILSSNNYTGKTFGLQYLFQFITLYKPALWLAHLKAFGTLTISSWSSEYSTCAVAKLIKARSTGSFSSRKINTYGLLTACIC